MGHKRRIAPATQLAGDDLTSALVGIGVQLAAEPNVSANIEDTLIAASIDGMEHHDLRVLALLVQWLGVHHAWINADRLVRLVREQQSRRVRAFWAACGRWLKKDRRLVRLARLYRGERVDVVATGTKFQISRHGEDARFLGGPLRVPANVLRERSADVLSPAELARRHRTYRWRVLVGPSYRADMLAALEAQPGLSSSELARVTYGSFSSAWQVKHDLDLLAAASTTFSPSLRPST
ncbi:MAG: hypothetical protein IT459_23020 [Planctomycetes bacterium]|nr:hypothetical protein [Planctomycetota bacterium]